MRQLLLVLLASCAIGSFLRGPEPPRLGETKWEVEARFGPSLTAGEHYSRYGWSICTGCVTGECPDVTLGLYPGPIRVLYDADGRVFMNEGDRRPWVCPRQRSHQCGWRPGWWEKP